MHAPGTSTITFLVLIPLLAWRIYSRFKRMVGRQRLSKVRPWITLAIFPILVLMLCMAALSHPEQLWLLAIGLVVGALLGVFGLAKTKFEPTPEALFYTPSAHVGIALSLLFVARIVYRMADVLVLNPQMPHESGGFASSPLTLGVFGLLAGYYVAYAIGLVRWRFRVLAAKQRCEAGESSASKPELE